MKERFGTKEKVAALITAGVIGYTALEVYEDKAAADAEQLQTEQAELLETSDRLADIVLDGLDEEDAIISIMASEDGMIGGSRSADRIDSDLNVTLSPGKKPGTTDIWLSKEVIEEYVNGRGTPVDVSLSVRYTSPDMDLEPGSQLPVNDIRAIIDTSDVTRIETYNIPVDLAQTEEISWSGVEVNEETGMLEPMTPSALGISVPTLTTKINEVLDSSH